MEEGRLVVPGREPGTVLALDEVRAVLDDFTELLVQHVPRERVWEARAAARAKIAAMTNGARVALPGERVLPAEEAQAQTRELLAAAAKRHAQSDDED